MHLLTQLESESTFVGACVGIGVGADVGASDAVGCSTGLEVGNAVVGVSVGAFVGAAVGARVPVRPTMLSSKLLGDLASPTIPAVTTFPPLATVSWRSFSAAISSLTSTPRARKAIDNAPATCGVAMEVPLRVDAQLSPDAHAERMLLPGANSWRQLP